MLIFYHSILFFFPWNYSIHGINYMWIKQVSDTYLGTNISPADIKLLKLFLEKVFLIKKKPYVLLLNK